MMGILGRLGLRRAGLWVGFYLLAMDGLGLAAGMTYL